MLTVSQAFYDLKSCLQPLYDEREASAIAHEALEYITGLGKTERLLQKERTLTKGENSAYGPAKAGLVKGRPIQYVTGIAWFMGRQFTVNEAVLIPRPETEELVQWVINDNLPASTKTILDIGTGSGCISISLKLAMALADITACDISSDALSVAAANAKDLGASVKFMQLDFLNAAQRNDMPAFDIIISNPPYIPQSEKERIHTNVKDHEPSIALFVPDDDALLFYRAIAAFGHKHLNSKGYIYCELDAAHATATKELFENEGYKHVALRKDMHDNYRMLKMQKS